MRRVLRFSIPAGFVAAAATFAGYWIARHATGVSTDEARTAATIVLFCVGLWILALLARPMTKMRVILLVAMGAAFLGALTINGVADFFALDAPPTNVLVGLIVVVGAAGLVLEMGRGRLRRVVQPRTNSGVWLAADVVGVGACDGVRRRATRDTDGG